MLTFLKSNNLQSLNQHGFAANRSTFTQLVECLCDWTSAAEMRLPAHVIYIDFKKAFDSVSHNKLLFKLTQMGFSNKLTAWISSFLLGRLQRVRCNNFLSCYKTVSSGVPQGSVLRPILFTVFINDLANMRLECKIKLFADDRKIYKIIRSILDRDILQKALNVISNWSNEWQLPISVIKCACLVLVKEDVKYNYVLSGQALPHVDNCSDLGIIVDKDLSFVQHMTKNCVKS